MNELDSLDDYQMPDGYGTTIGKCLTFAEIEGLLAAERERCAAVAVAFDWGPWWHEDQIQHAIAAQIRSLPPQTERGPQ